MGRGPGFPADGAAEKRAVQSFFDDHEWARTSRLHRGRSPFRNEETGAGTGKSHRTLEMVGSTSLTGAPRRFVRIGLPQLILTNGVRVAPTRQHPTGSTRLQDLGSEWS